VLWQLPLHNLSLSRLVLVVLQAVLAITLFFQLLHRQLVVILVRMKVLNQTGKLVVRVVVEVLDSLQQLQPQRVVQAQSIRGLLVAQDLQIMWRFFQVEVAVAQAVLVWLEQATQRMEELVLRQASLEVR